MDKKSLLAVGICMLIFLGWQKYYLEPIQRERALQAKQAHDLAVARAASEKPATEAKVAEGAPAPFPAGPAAKLTAVKSLELGNDRASASVSNEPWVVRSWELKDFSLSLEKRDQKITINDVTGFSTQVKLRFSDPALSKSIEQPWQSIEKTGDRAATAKTATPDFQASRTITLDDSGYGGTVSYQFHFAKEPPKFAFLDLVGSPKRATDKEGSIFGQAPDKVKVSYRDLNGRHSLMGASLKENQESNAGVRWIGLDTRYFVLALVPGSEDPKDIGAQVAHDDVGGPAVRGSLVFPSNGKKDFTVSAKIYFGPKDMASLKKVDPILSDAIDFGWTSFIAIPLLEALKWLYTYVKNYGIAIILLTFLIKMALFPLMYKSMKSMAKMTKLQPQLNALRAKYKDDKEKLNVEMMNFMRANGYNPIGGCLPIIFQMPIFFALYRVLFNSMELYQAPFGLWIHDLSSPDRFFVTPVLLCGLMFVQQKLSPNAAADPAQQKMMQIMPLMFGAFMLMLPSGLTIYMVVNSVMTILQQYFINRRLGIRPGANAQVLAKA